MLYRKEYRKAIVRDSGYIKTRKDGIEIMTPELKDLYRHAIEQKDREIAALKTRVLALEKELGRSPTVELPHIEQVTLAAGSQTITA